MWTARGVFAVSEKIPTNEAAHAIEKKFVNGMCMGSEYHPDRIYKFQRKQYVVLSNSLQPDQHLTVTITKLDLQGLPKQLRNSTPCALAATYSLAPFGIKIGTVSKSEDDRMHEVHLHSLVNPTRRVVTPRLHKRPGTTSESKEEDRTCMSAQRSRPSNKSFGHQIAIQSSKANRSAAKVDLKHRSSRLIAIIKMPNRISSFKAPGTTANLQKLDEHSIGNVLTNEKMITATVNQLATSVQADEFPVRSLQIELHEPGHRHRHSAWRSSIASSSSSLMFSGKRLDTVSEVSPMASQRLPCTSMLATAYCNRLDQFCAQLQNNCSSLLSIAKVKPKPESRGYNFAIFLEDLNDDISSALTELTHLEERTTDTLSFEELLVHCDALYESNEDGIRKLELQLQQYGYAPDVLHETTYQEMRTNSHTQDEEISSHKSAATPALMNVNETSKVTPTALSYNIKNAKRDVEYSPLFGDLGDLENLESLGISATSLTALTGQDEPVSSVHPSLQKLTFVESPTNEDARISLRDAEMEDNLNTKYGSDWFPESKKKAPPPPSESDSRLISTQRNAEVCSNPLVHNKPKSEHGDGATNATPTTSTPIRDENFQSLDTKKVPSLNEISSVQYDHLPLWLKSQVSFEEVNAAVTKINELIRQRGTQGEHANQFFLDQKDVQSLELGIMALTKAEKLVTQFINGVTAYRICVQELVLPP
nr:uncharacterized protein LOC112281590 [Physcomitrium patens]|eukprot:XP_024374009.1 uncharacterized protein LOC112281590 [Physcomitrella patens]